MENLNKEAVDVAAKGIEKKEVVKKTGTEEVIPANLTKLSAEDIKRIMDNETLVLRDEELKNICITRFDDMSDDQKSKLPQLRFIVVERQGRNEIIYRASLQIEKNTVMRMFLTPQQYNLIKMFKPEAFDKDSGCRIPTKLMVHQYADKNTGELNYGFSYLGYVCPGLIMGTPTQTTYNGMKRMNYINNFRTVDLTSIKAHNARFPDKKIQFVYIGERASKNNSSYEEFGSDFDEE